LPINGYFNLKIPKESVIFQSGFTIKADSNTHSYNLISNGTDYYEIEIV